jgi:purine catabolism regulator
MVVKLKTFIESELFKTAEIIAGKQGENNSVRSINILDTPDGYLFMDEGTLCITSGYAWLQDPKEQETLLRNLKHKKVAGLAMMLRFFKGSLPDGLKQMADELGVPIVSIDDELSYMDIIRYFENHIYSTALGKFLDTKLLNEQMLACLGKKVMQDLTHALNRFLGKDVYLCMGEKCFAIEEISEFEKIRSQVENWVELGDVAIHTDCLNRACLYETRIGENVHRWLSCELKEGDRLNNVIHIKENHIDFTENDYVIIELALRVLDLDFKNQAIDFEQHIAELVNLLFDYSHLDYESLKQEMDENEFKIDEQMGVLLFPENISHTVLHKVNSILINHYNSKLIMGNYGDYFIIIYPQISDGEERIRNMSMTLCNHFMPVGKRYAAIGNVVDLSELASSYSQAKETLYWTSKREIKDVQTYEELGFLRLFAKSEYMESIEDYCQGMLGPVIEYDKKKGSDLLETLIALVDNQWSDTQAARALFVHKNTIKYRLNLITKLVNMELSAGPKRFNMECAIRLHTFFHA